MSVLTKTIYKTVALEPGEPFTLPPGATMVGASNSSVIDSTCDIPSLEEAICYVALVAAAGEEGSVGQYFESGSVSIRGFTLNGVETRFTTAYAADNDGLYNIFSMLEELKTRVGAIIASTAAADSNNQRGSLTYAVIKTIPSIGKNMSLVLETSIAHTGYNQTLAVYAPFVTRDSIASSGYIGLPACP